MNSKKKNDFYFIYALHQFNQLNQGGFIPFHIYKLYNIETYVYVYNSCYFISIIREFVLDVI